VKERGQGIKASYVQKTFYGEKGRKLTNVGRWAGSEMLGGEKGMTFSSMERKERMRVTRRALG
jgi:hypothetical protein